MRSLLRVAVILASLACSVHADLLESNAAAPVAQHLTMTTKCRHKEDCPENYYCGGRSNSKCQECIDCSKHQRKPKIATYDGETCAKHPSDCGDCLPGYEASGGVCQPSSDFSTPVNSYVDMRIDETSKDNGQPESIEANASIWAVVTLAILLMLVGGFMVVRKLYYNQKDSRNRNEEEAGLTAYNGPYDASAPQAPPEEYTSQQPPFFSTYPSTPSFTGGGNFRPTVTQCHSKALPFDEGNGPSRWIVNGNNFENALDTVDGAGASTPTNPEPASISNNVTARNNLPNNEGETTNGNIGNQQHNHAHVAHPRLGQNQAIGQYQPPGFQQGPPLPQPDPHNTRDPVVGEFFFYGGFGFRMQGPNTNASGASGTRLVVTSAPTSPSRIDDTYPVDVMELRESFRSNQSLDSGTGTDHDRSVPSIGSDMRFSDLDDSDDARSPQSQHHDAEVPTQEEDDDMVYEE